LRESEPQKRAADKSQIAIFSMLKSKEVNVAVQ